MNKLEIEQTYKSPKVILDPHKNHYEISGHSIPENAVVAYTPLFNWVDNNLTKIDAPILEFNFKLDYMNSSSARMLIMFFSKLEELSNENRQVLIKWFYEDNEDDLDIGKLYQASTKLAFELIPIKEN